MSVAPQIAPTGATLTATPTVVARRERDGHADDGRDAAEGEASGFIVLTRGTDARRVPFWFRVDRRRSSAPSRTTLLHGPGVYHGNTKGKLSRVSSYRYPGSERRAPRSRSTCPGPSRSSASRPNGPLANFGAVVTSRGPA